MLEKQQICEERGCQRDYPDCECVKIMIGGLDGRLKYFSGIIRTQKEVIMEGIGKGLLTAVIALCLIAAAAAWGLKSVFTDGSIKSEVRIEPEIELKINDNKVDTIYIYREP